MTSKTNQDIKFAIYARKSQESDERQVQSIPDQIKIAQDIQQRFGYNVIETISEAKSAKAPNIRSEFTRLIERIRLGEINGLLVWKYDRLSRNPEESGIIQQLLQDRKIEVIQTPDRIFASDDNALILSVESGSANQFILDLRKNTKRGLWSKFEQGILPGLAPLGYMNTADPNNAGIRIIVPDPERFDIVRRMFDYLLSGAYTPREIRDIAVSDWGLTTRRRGKRSGNPIAMSSVYRILANPFYAGIIRYKGQERDGIHTPMLTMDEFEKAQFILGDRGKPRKKTHDFAYSAIMECPSCGVSVVGERKTKLVKSENVLRDYEYYRCTRSKNQRGGYKCPQPVATLKEVEEQIEAALQQVSIPEELLEWAFEMVDSMEDEQVIINQKIIDNQKREIQKRTKKIDKLIGMCASGLIDEEQFKQQKEDIDTQIRDLEKALKKAKQVQQTLEPVKDALQFSAHALAEFQNGDHKKKRTLVKKLGDRFYLDNKKVIFEVKPELRPMLKYGKEVFETLELTKTTVNTNKNEAFASLIPIMGG